MANYWCVNFGDNEHLRYGLANNLWSMQYQYEEQSTNLVTEHWNFVKRVKQGDWLIAYTRPSKFYSIGKVISPRNYLTDQHDRIERTVTDRRHRFRRGIVLYEDAEAFYENLESNNGFKGEFGQRIDVEKWLYINEDGIEVKGLQTAKKAGYTIRTSIFGITKTFFNRIENKLRGVNLPEWDDEMRDDEIRKVLEISHQVILTGPPGTSKTYEAKILAASILAPQLQIPDDEVEDEINAENEVKKVGKFYPSQFDGTQGYWTIVQFHPSYNYEDFIRGIRVIPQGEKVIYRVENRILGRIAERARIDWEGWKEENSSKDFLSPDESCPRYVLIIDEINRANLASVLGELIYSLEYRGSQVETPYEMEEEVEQSGKRKSGKIVIPPNLYIIGTMNTADRSVGHIDYAIRRRFTFIPLLPRIEVIENYYDKTDQNKDLKGHAMSLFKAVETLFDKNCAQDFHKDDVQVGHTYFFAKNTDELITKFIYQVYPLLREYYKDGILVPSDNGEIRLRLGDDVSINIKELEDSENVRTLLSNKL